MFMELIVFICNKVFKLKSKSSKAHRRNGSFTELYDLAFKVHLRGLIFEGNRKKSTSKIELKMKCSDEKGPDEY